MQETQEMQIQSLGWKDSLEEENGNLLQYSCLENPMDREAGGLQSTGSQRVRHDWVTEHACIAVIIKCIQHFAFHQDMLIKNTFLKTGKNHL